MLHIGNYCMKSSLGILKMCVLRSSSEFQNYSIISKYLRHHKNKIRVYTTTIYHRNNNNKNIELEIVFVLLVVVSYTYPQAIFYIYVHTVEKCIYVFCICVRRIII